MDNPAVVIARDDGNPAVDRVLPGHLVVGPDYDSVRPHGTPDWLLILSVDGCGRVWPTGSLALDIPPRSAVTFSPGTPQHYATQPVTARWNLLWVHFRPRPEWLALLDWPTVAPGVGLLELSPVVSERVAEALTSAVAHHRGSLRQATHLAVNSVEAALLWCSTENPLQGSTDPVVLAVVEHVSSHLDHPHTVRSLAVVAGISPSHLAHVFVQRTGGSVMGHVLRLRIAAACELLDLTPLSVAQVATRVGFTDPLYFSRCFRRATGSSPRAYRRRTAIPD